MWIVDPLDGTREWGEGRTDWAVHVALAFDGMPSAARGRAARARQRAAHRRPPPHDLGDMPAKVRLLVSRTRPPKVAEYLAERARRRARAAGFGRRQGDGVVLGRRRRVRAQRRPVRVGLGRARSASPPRRAATARGSTAAPLVYNHADPYLPDLLVCRPEIEVRLRAAIATAPPELTA